jgi:ABC-2 type transport system permease protein
MLAIMKRDFRSYFNSPIAYVLIGLFVFIMSIMFMGTVQGGSADFTNGFASMNTLLLFILPILCMRAFTEDKKQGTEVLLLTSPNSLTSIVAGKFLAVYGVFLVMTAITFVYPLVLFVFGKPEGMTILSSYAGFLIYGAVAVAMCVFASSLTENQIVSAVIGFVMLFLLMVIDYLASLTGGVVGQVLTWLSLNERYQQFSQGIFDVTSIVFMLSFVAAFGYFTIRVLERKRWSQG